MEHRADQYTDDPEVRDLVVEVLEAGDDWSDGLRERLVEGGDTVGRALIAMVEDRELAAPEGPVGGRTVAGLVEVIGERGEAGAVGPLVELLVDVDYDTLTFSRAVYALKEIGEPAVDPMIEAVEEGCGPVTRNAIADVLSDFDIDDDRIFAVLTQVLDEEPGLGASYLADYGDEEALELLHQRFQQLEIVEAGGPMANDPFSELALAIERLGGTLTEAEREKLDEADRRRRESLKERFQSGGGPLEGPGAGVGGPSGPGFPPGNDSDGSE